MKIECDNTCELFSSQIQPIVNKDSSILLLVDFPSPGDERQGVIFSALDDRAQAFFEALSLAKLDPDEVNIAPSVRCVTRAKDMRASVIAHCAHELVSHLDHVDRILCFGAATFCALTGLPIKQIDQYRSTYQTVTISGKQRKVGCTYSLALVSGSGCVSCSKSTYTILMGKDIVRLMREK